MAELEEHVYAPIPVSVPFATGYRRPGVNKSLRIIPKGRAIRHPLSMCGDAYSSIIRTALLLP